jgi:hypothetical protein
MRSNKRRQVMGAPLLVFVGAIYVAVAADYARQSRYGMAVAFVAYGLANLGFAWDARR